MQSNALSLTNNFQELIDFSKLRVRYSNIEIQNFDNDTALEFTLRLGGDIIIRVPNNSTTTREGFPLAGVLYGRAVTGTATITIDYW